MTVTEFLRRRTLVIQASEELKEVQTQNEALIHSLVPAFLAKVPSLTHVCVCMYVCTYIHSLVPAFLGKVSSSHACVCMCVSMYILVPTCLENVLSSNACFYVNVHIHTHIHTHILLCAPLTRVYMPWQELALMYV